MRDIPWRLRVYFCLVYIAGATLLCTLAPSLRGHDIPYILGFAAGIWALEMTRWVLPSGEGISLSAGLVMMVLWVHGPAVAAFADALGVLAASPFRRSTQRQAPFVMFDLGQLVLTVYSTWWVFQLAGRLFGSPALHNVPALLSSGAAFLFANSVLLEFGLSLYKQVPFWGLWWESTRGYGLRFVLALVFALFLVAGYPYFGPLLVGVVLLFVGAQWYFLQRFVQGSQERAVNSLLELAALRDEYRPGHSDRVLRYASAIAAQMHLGEGETRILRYAALLHDVGMSTALPRAVVERHSVLKAEEAARMRQHPVEGARVLSRLKPLVPVARIVRHHHEWYNGGGYPAGFSRNAIPLGARILAVADAFDALTIDLPHRRAFSAPRALDELRAQAGAQFDPAVVAALDRALERDRALSDAAAHGQGLDEEIALTILHLREYIGDARPDARLPRSVPGGRDRDDGVLREVREKAAGIVALYDLGQVINSSLSLDDVLDRVARTTARAIHSGCALLLLDEAGTNLEFRAVHGASAEKVRPAPLPAAFGPWGEALRMGRPAVSTARAASPRFLPGERPAHIACVPLTSKDRPIGVVCAFRSRPQPFSATEVDLLTVIASQAALAVENAKLYSQTKDRLDQITVMKQFTDTVLETIGTGIVVVDEAGWTQMVNRAAREIAASLGGAVFDVAGRPHLVAASGGTAAGGTAAGGAAADEAATAGEPGGAAATGDALTRLLGIDDLLAAAMATGTDRYAAERRVVGPARTCILEVHASPLCDAHGAATRALGVFRDVTERRRLEDQVRQAQQMAMIGELAAGAAHEIRNPLTSIRGFIQVLQEKAAVDGVEKEYVGIVMNEIDRIDGILRELLMLARPPSLKLQECHLQSLLDEVSTLVLRGLPAGVRPRLQREYDAGVPPMLADVRQLRQVFLNLITNAVQAMPEGGCLTLRTAAGAGEVQARVEDTGVGIRAEDLGRVFAPFFTTKDQGTGLGLSVTFGIVANHGGRIEVQSEPGRGATFTVHLPLRPPGAPAAAAAGR
jgi:signal transduction histidine kinase